MLRLEPVLNVMRDAIERYDGLVAQTMGDGIMALFGSPKPHEDHALRGCLAAMAMQEAVGRLGDTDLAIRVGLHTGETVFENSDLNYDVRGANVHLASRMERMAEKGKILITRDTFNAARQSINVASLGLQEVRGLSTPVEIFELKGLQYARSNEYFRGSLRLSQFVGRDDELATLEKALASARRGEARVVGVVGDAGFGKSRLCYEFAEACRRQDVRVREARVLEHGAATPYQPVLDLFRDFFGIQWKEPASVSQQRVKDLLQSRGDFGEVLPLLLEFLGIPDANLKAPKLSPETLQTAPPQIHQTTHTFATS